MVISMTRLGLGLLVLGVAACADGIDPPEPTAVVALAGGSFTMGAAVGDGCGLFEARDRRAFLPTEPRYESARATHEVTVQAFCIDAHEVTNEQYRHCVAREDCGYPESTNAGNRGQPGFVAQYYTDEEGYDQFPVLGVSYDDAVAYCAFRGGYLPTEAQWEYAATSLGRRDRVWDDTAFDQLIPGACETDPDRYGAVGVGSCATGIAAVASASGDVTAQQVYDMAGNAAEWVADDFDFFAYCAPEQPGGRIDELFTVDGRTPLSRASQTFIAPFMPMQPDDSAPLVLASPGVGGSGYDGACHSALEGCTDRCGDAFGVDGAVDAQKARWRGYLCGDERGLTNEVVDRLLGGERDAETGVPGCDAECAAGWDNCLTTAPDAPADGAVCVRACQSSVDRCLVQATVEGASTACIQFESAANCVPVPWCVPRSDYAAEQPHIRSTALTSDALRGTKTVRGGHFQTTRLCEAFPTWRGYELVSSPLVGFRCAFDPGDGRCPDR